MDRGEGEPGRAADEVIDLLGRFVRDERVIACLTRLGAAEPYLTIEGAFAAYGRPKETGLPLSAMSLAEFRGTFGEPRSTVGGAQDALILSRIDFSDADCAAPGSRAYDGPLPFGLRFGDPGAAVGERLGAKPRRKDRSGDLPGRSPVAFVWEYHVGALSVIAKLTAQQRLAALYLAPLGRTARQAREREAGLEAASATIDPDCGPRIEALRAALPTARWREAAAKPDSDMVVEEIAVAEGALHRYLDAVRSAAAQRSAPPALRRHGASRPRPQPPQPQERPDRDPGAGRTRGAHRRRPHGGGPRTGRGRGHHPDLAGMVTACGRHRLPPAVPQSVRRRG